MNGQFHKRFYFKTYLRILSVVNPLVLFGVTILLIFFSLAFFREVKASLLNNIFLLLVLILFPLLAIATFGNAMLVLVTHTIPIFMSRLDITDAGLEYQYWPTYHIRCSWEDVECIKKKREIVMADVIMLWHATELGKPITMKIRKKLGMDLQYFIPLNVFDEWPGGEIRDLLMRYAPQAFGDQALNPPSS